MNNSFIYSSLMILAGLGIPVMAALNGGLGGRLQSPAAAAAILFGLGLLITTVYVLATEGLPSTLYVAGTPWYFYCGGFFVAFYVLTITWVAPRFGVSNAIALVLLGQLIAMSLIDHFGLLNVPQYTISFQRLFGLVLMACGVFMVLNKAS
ncbi:MAG TPA: DMT family transporter [Cellvibrio sp.]|nr:DMT family transporter [Cellvibrio sp.]